MNNKFKNKLACRQSEESRFPSRRCFAPPQDDAGRLEDKADVIDYSWRIPCDL